MIHISNQKIKKVLNHNEMDDRMIRRNQDTLQLVKE